ncbi:hypothetical protein [Nocardioides ferulae]|uniref:hypothetical protein n=1 Tax=Nocardioides ferulae TaxID=2340821 RepID=UPI000F882AB5|nr:hypothetical protein [Nocardioides ferulae]
MDLGAFDALATSYAGVRRRATEGDLRWQCRGRLVARRLDDDHVVVRVPFDVRDVLLRTAPAVFSVPSRFTKHMMVVADLTADGADDAVADAVESAWRHTGEDLPEVEPAETTDTVSRGGAR